MNVSDDMTYNSNTAEQAFDQPKIDLQNVFYWWIDNGLIFSLGKCNVLHPNTNLDLAIM